MFKSWLYHHWLCNLGKSCSPFWASLSLSFLIYQNKSNPCPWKINWERRHKSTISCVSVTAMMHIYMKGFYISLKSLLLDVPGLLPCCINLSAGSGKNFPQWLKQNADTSSMAKSWVETLILLAPSFSWSPLGQCCPTEHWSVYTTWWLLSTWYMAGVIRIFTHLSSHKSWV